MAFRFVDPASFMPRGCTRVAVNGRKLMSRAVLGGLRGRNSDVAIVTVDPLPKEHVSFTSIRDLVNDFLSNHQRVGYHSIQP